MRPFKIALQRWRGAAVDGEQAMVMNRFIAGLLVLAFNTWAVPRGLTSGVPLIASAIYLLLGGLIGVHLIIRPVVSTPRRVAAMLLDCGAISYELYAGGGAAAWLFASYLWVVFGNGFRFGSRFQALGMVVTTIGYLVVVAFTPFWRDQPALVIGGVVSLAIVPLYALALIKRLSRATQQAEEANRAKSLFLASVSHELRTPLNAVIGMGALLESTDLNSEQSHMSHTIMVSARSLLSLIDGILDLSSIEAGRVSTASSDFDLAQLLHEIRIIFAAQARLKGVRLNLHVAARTPLLLHGDGRRLHEILLNLVGNALKFTDAGSVTVAVDAISRQDEQVRLRFEVMDTGIGIAPEARERIFDVFTQADDSIVNRFGGTGLGLAIVRKSLHLLGGEIGVESAPGAGSTFWFELGLQKQPAVADETRSFPDLRAFVLGRCPDAVVPLLGRLADLGVRIEQADAAPPDWMTSTATPSRCLLAFDSIGPNTPKRSFAEASAADMLSFVDVREAPTTGLAVEGLPVGAPRRDFASILYLPASAAEIACVLRFVAATVGHGAPAERPLPGARESYNLLVADDNATNRHVLQKIFRSAGHTVTLVADGEQALDALAEQNFDAAVLDVNMPVMGGIEAAKIYRMTSIGSVAIPLLALTADATPATRDRCLEAGMAACAVKPVEPARLLALIDEIVGKARDEGARSAALADPRIADIAAHPRFRGALPPALDAHVVSGLRMLGGDEFVTEVADSARSESRARFEDLRTAASLGDVAGFRAQAHGLHSVAANIGAKHLSDICRPFETTSADELYRQSPAWLADVEAELERVEAALIEACRGEPAQLSR
jgi:two-component system sensor histidine kinase RpfC